ncbi:MAG: lysophospholipase [Proteobacteria bacterium]|nr:lysophospholipase [Pseudomonadota bacterium]
MEAGPSLVTADGLALTLRVWPVARAQGSVLIVHGLGEHVGRYAAVAAQLNRWGWCVAGYDQRGHGASQGPRGGLAHPEALLEDLARVVDAARASLPGPLLLLGHSLGGLVAARFAAGGGAWERPVDALVLSSPALDPGMNAIQKALLAVLGPIAPNLALGNGLKPAWISRDPAVVQAYIDDPLVHDRVTPRLVRFIVDAGRIVRERAATWSVPTLLLYAGSDRCVDPAGSRAFAASAPPAFVARREFAALAHEIFNEPERDQVFAALRSWLGAIAPVSVDH